MNEWIFQLELFWRPAITGGLLALLLPVLGLTLRLRKEYWAALAYGQIGAAGALLALALGLPLLPGGLAASLAVAAVKNPLEERKLRVVHFPLLFVLGWSICHLLTANLPGVKRAGVALFEGQLYFAGVEMLVGAVIAAIMVVMYMKSQGRALLLAYLYPVHFRAQGGPTWWVRTGFDLLVAAVLALSVMCLGVMGAFSLVFLPPWVASAFSTSWRQALITGAVLSFAAYGCAFMLAIVFDQPFGPAMVFVLCAMALLVQVATVVRRKTGR